MEIVYHAQKHFVMMGNEQQNMKNPVGFHDIAHSLNMDVDYWIFMTQ